MSIAIICAGQRAHDGLSRAPEGDAVLAVCCGGVAEKGLRVTVEGQTPFAKAGEAAGELTPARRTDPNSKALSLYDLCCLGGVCPYICASCSASHRGHGCRNTAMSSATMMAGARMKSQPVSHRGHKNRRKKKKCSKQKRDIDWRFALTITIPSILNAVLPIILRHFA